MRSERGLDFVGPFPIAPGVFGEINRRLSVRFDRKRDSRISIEEMDDRSQVPHGDRFRRQPGADAP